MLTSLVVHRSLSAARGRHLSIDRDEHKVNVTLGVMLREALCTGYTIGSIGHFAGLTMFPSQFLWHKYHNSIPLTAAFQKKLRNSLPGAHVTLTQHQMYFQVPISNQ
jgi:hypothetical protein